MNKDLQFLDLTELTNFQGKKLLKEFTCDICEKGFTEKDIEEGDYRFVLSPQHTNKLTRLKENIYDLTLRVISVDHKTCTQKEEKKEQINNVANAQKAKEVNKVKMGDTILYLNNWKLKLES